MDYSAFLLTLFPASISCVAAVVSWLNAKKPASIELHQTVDEMVTLIEKMMKEQRKVKMSNVRNAAKDSGDTQVDPASPETSLQHNQPSKIALRQLARAKGILK